MLVKFVSTGIAITLALVILSPTIARANLLGSEVTAVLFFPDETTFATGPLGPVTVTSGIEFPMGTLSTDGSLDITGSQVIFTAMVATTYPTGVASPGAGAFDGIDVFFTGGPTIINVTVDPVSTILPVPFAGPPVSSASGVSFTGDNILFNGAGDSVTVGQQLILDVAVAPSAVPEPASAILLGTGLLGGLAILRRKFMP